MTDDYLQDFQTFPDLPYKWKEEFEEPQEDENPKEKEGPFDIYAEVTRKQLAGLEDGTMSFLLPDGVSLQRRPGSRACYFTCDDKEAFESLKEMLDDSYISWQEN